MFKDIKQKQQLTKVLLDFEPQLFGTCISQCFVAVSRKHSMLISTGINLGS